MCVATRRYCSMIWPFWTEHICRCLYRDHCKRINSIRAIRNTTIPLPINISSFPFRFFIVVVDLIQNRMAIFVSNHQVYVYGFGCENLWFTVRVKQTDMCSTVSVTLSLESRPEHLHDLMTNKVRMDELRIVGNLLMINELPDDTCLLVTWFDDLWWWCGPSDQV